MSSSSTGSRRAIFSVSDKTGIDGFARGLCELGYSILSTGGTAKFLREQGIEVTEVSEYTGHPEILGGRVKSLHPKIHGGILARRENADDMQELRENGIDPIDVVVVNLYPFFAKCSEVVEAADARHESLVESIDIGGPTMIRAAAKNCADVLPVADPDDYENILETLREGEVAIDYRRQLAEKVFAMMRSYDGAIARYFSFGEQLLDENGKQKVLAKEETLPLQRQMTLRYGENPHQQAGLYTDSRAESNGGQKGAGKRAWTQLQGKELSYNNLLDMYAALDIFLELEETTDADSQAAVVIKHSNPCGAAIAATVSEAFVDARACDPLSAFGSIVVLGDTVSGSLAETICEGFVEVLLAPGYSDDAMEVFAAKKNLRVLSCDYAALQARRAEPSISVRTFYDEYLLQTVDATLLKLSEELLMAGPSVGADEIRRMQFAWAVAKHVKSNTIVIENDFQAIGVGAGQMSRVDAAKIAIQRARTHGHSLEGAFAASDAFLPFPDTLEILAEAGIRGLVQPGGSIKDQVVIERAEELGVSMLFTGERHFRH